MKKRWKIVLIVLGVIVAIIAGIVWWQFDNIKAVYYSYKYDNETIERMIKKQNEDVDKYLKEHGNYNVRPSTDTENKLHHEGLIEDNEFVDILTGETSVNDMFGMDVLLDDNERFVDSSGTSVTIKDLETAKEQNKSSVSPDSANSGNNPALPSDTQTADQKASESIAQMYVLKSTFTSKLDSLYAEAVQYYSGMTAEQKKNAKSELLDKFYSRATSLEAECDSKVNSILADLDKTLTESGGDKSVIGKIRDAYSQEKSLKKAYYLNKLK